MSQAPYDRRFVSEFVERLEALDRADLARLKRGAGRRLEEYPEVFPLFYRLLPERIRGWPSGEGAYFLVATLFPLAPSGDGPRFEGDLGRSLFDLRQRKPESREALDRRLAILLDCDSDALPFRLRQMVRLIATSEGHVDWRQLLEDVLAWDLPWRPTHKRWARSYFGAQLVEPETAPATQAAAAESKRRKERC